MHSIRFKFMAFISALLLVLLFLVNTYPLASSRDLVFEEKRNSMIAQGSLLSSALSTADSLSANSIKEIISLLDISGYSRTIVANADGRVLYDDGGIGAARLSDSDASAALSGKVIFRSDFRSHAFSSSVCVPIGKNGTINGFISLFEVDTERAEIIIDMQTRIRLLSLVIGAAALLMSVFFSMVLMNRLKELIQSMRIVAGGDYGYRLATRGRDEITELGDEFNLLTSRLDDTERQRRRFVSDASHELKTPLASIRLLSDSIVQNGNMDVGTMREFVTDIGSEANRLQRTTEKLLDLSRLDDGVQILPEPVDVKQVAVDSLVVIKPLADERGIHIKCELDDGCVIMATSDDLFHIIFNLMENAVKYNVPDGSVLITLHGDEENVRFTVEDTGIGIPEEDRFNIFGRFYRVDKARSREAGGSGLGLSIVHDAVLAHGGTIAVGQNKPQGSVFIVTFPRPTSEETGI